MYFTLALASDSSVLNYAANTLSSLPTFTLSHHYWAQYLSCNIHETRAETLTPKYPRLPRSIYVQHVETVKQSRQMSTCREWRAWNSEAHETEQSRYSWLSGAYVVVMFFQHGKTWILDVLSHIWPWRSRSTPPSPPPPKKKTKKKQGF